MPQNSIDKEITGYLNKLSIAQKKAVLTVVKTFADEEMNVSLLNERFAAYEKGKVKPLTLDELETKTRNTYKARKTKK